MLGITFIGSGSKGNSALLELNNSYYLLDAGISCKRICDYLATRALSISDIKGIFITHEHDDHIKGLKVLLKKAPELKIYCTGGTAEAMCLKGIESENIEEVKYNTSFQLDECLCTAFEVPHDAAQPMGLRIQYNEFIMAMATDLGCVTPTVIKNTEDADLLCIESNYDLNMLKRSSYPSFLISRIKSKHGHLPNEGVIGVLSKMKKIPQSLVLMHLSQESNTKELALKNLEPFFQFDGARFKDVHIEVASQDTPTQRLTVGESLSDDLKKKLISKLSKKTKQVEVAG